MYICTVNVLLHSIPFGSVLFSIHNRETVCIFSVQSFIRCLYHCSGSRRSCTTNVVVFVTFAVVVVVVRVVVVVVAVAVAAIAAAAALYRFGIILKWIFVVGRRVVVLLFGERALRRV